MTSVSLEPKPQSCRKRQVPSAWGPGERGGREQTVNDYVGQMCVRTYCLPPGDPRSRMAVHRAVCKSQAGQVRVPGLIQERMCGGRMGQAHRPQERSPAREVDGTALLVAVARGEASATWTESAAAPSALESGVSVPAEPTMPELMCKINSPRGLPAPLNPGQGSVRRCEKRPGGQVRCLLPRQAGGGQPWLVGHWAV